MAALRRGTGDEECRRCKREVKKKVDVVSTISRELSDVEIVSGACEV